jgi:hypothetical protein
MTGLSAIAGMNLGRFPGNYLTYAKTVPTPAQNCAFWASLADKSTRTKCRLAGGARGGGIEYNLC